MAAKNGKVYGKDTTHNPAVSKYGTSTVGAASDPVDWQDVSGPLLKELVVSVTRDSGGIILSRTSDGGALSVTLLVGDGRIKKYFTSTDDAERQLEVWINAAKT